MKIVSTFHPSSSVISSVKCRLSTRDLEHLVVVKLNRIDVYSLRPHGLQHECGLDVWGKICSVKHLPISTYEGRSNIVLMITHPDPELLFLSYQEGKGGKAEIIVEKQLSLFERTPRLAEFFTDFLIHPSGNLAIASCYAGKLKVITLKAGLFVQEFDVLLPEINVFSLAFLPSEDDEYTLAILYLDSQQRLQLCARDVDVANLELSSDHSFLFLSTAISEKVIPYPTDSPLLLIPVPPDASALNGDEADDLFHGGVLVVGGRQLLLFDVASKDGQEKQKGKRRRLDNKKKSKDPTEASQARIKERERESRRRKPKASIEWPWSEVTAWTAIDEKCSRFLLGEAFGRFSMLSLDNLSSLGMILVPLGETSKPMTLTYLTNQVVYLGSHEGDSQLLQISSTPISDEKVPNLAIPSEIKTVSVGSLAATPSKKGKAKALSQDDMDVDASGTDADYSKGRIVTPGGSFLTVLDSYKNIAPIMDAILVDTDGSGQNQIVTCSGSANTGSVNVIRNGADFKELAFVPGLVDVTRAWPVKTMINDEHDSHILISTITESHLLQIDPSKPGVLKRVPTGHIGNLITDQPTLAFSNIYRKPDRDYINSSLVVQVVPSGVHLFEWDSVSLCYVAMFEWDVKKPSTSGARQPAQEIVAASANKSQVVLALHGGTIVLLRTANAGATIVEQRSLDIKRAHGIPREISALSLSPLKAHLPFSNQIPVAYWGTNIIEIYDATADGLKVAITSPPLPALVRSVLLYNFGADNTSKGEDYHPYLVAGLSDGSVATMFYRSGKLSDLKIISLGHAPVHLTPCVVDGKKAIFVAGNRATILSMDKGRLTNSPIMLKEISAVSSLNTEAFPSALLLASPTGLFIGRVGDLDKMHIRTAALGLDNPSRIVYQPSLKAYGVACKRIAPGRIGYETARSSFQLLDDNTLTVLGQYRCEPNEEITSVTTLSSTVDGQEQHFFCVGTFIYNPEEREPSLGRLLLFTAFANSGRRASLELSMLASENVIGCVFALKVVEDKIVAAVNSAILLFSLETSSENGLTPIYSLKKLAEWNHNYMVTSLGSINNRIVAGDQISSVSLLTVKDNKLVSEARDYGPLFPVTVEALDSNNLICANDALNISLYSLTKNIRGEYLEAVGSYHVADMVTKVLRGSMAAVDQAQDSALRPELLFFTSSGRIGAIIDVPDHDLSLRLTELQRNLAGAISGIGGVSHARFRAPKNTRGPSDADTAAYGFLDGDFLERYLTLLDSPDKLKRVMEGTSQYEFEKLKLSKEEILSTLEQLQGLH